MHVKVHEDNVGTLILGKLEPGRIIPCSKHYAVKYHWFHEQIGPRGVDLVKIATQDQLGDLFTKGLVKISFKQMQKRLMGWWPMFALSRGSMMDASHFPKTLPSTRFFFVMSDVKITPVNSDTSSTPLSCVELHKVLQARPESSPLVGESLDITWYNVYLTSRITWHHLTRCLLDIFIFIAASSKMVAIIFRFSSINTCLLVNSCKNMKARPLYLARCHCRPCPLLSSSLPFFPLVLLVDCCLWALPLIAADVFVVVFLAVVIVLARCRCHPCLLSLSSSPFLPLPLLVDCCL